MKALVEARRLAIPRRLEETSLDLAAGELVCLIGPNGSGKTSLLHALAGIESATGEVRIDGEDPRRLPPQQRQRLLSYLPASRDIGWPISARDVISLGNPVDEPARVEALLSEFELLHLTERPIDRLSTGERSRVLIARALVTRPKLLLLDEPVSNPDPLWQLRLMDYLRALARQGEQALLVAMHDLELARTYADRLIIMNKGRIEADGEPPEILNGPCVRSVFGVEQVDGRWRPVA